MDARSSVRRVPDASTSSATGGRSRARRVPDASTSSATNPVRPRASRGSVDVHAPTTGRRTPPRRHRALRGTGGRRGRRRATPTAARSASERSRPDARARRGTPPAPAAIRLAARRAPGPQQRAPHPECRRGVMTTASHPPATPPRGPRAASQTSPSRQSATVTTDAGSGTRAATSSADAPTRTTTSSQPPSRSMSTAFATHACAVGARARVPWAARTACRRPRRGRVRRRASTLRTRTTSDLPPCVSRQPPFSRQRSAPETRRG